MVSALHQSPELSPEAFAAFLAQLSPDPERAGEAYEDLRQMMVKFLECRGVAFADEWADEVFNRVMRRVVEGEMIENMPGYCFSVARFVVMERARAPENRRVEMENLPPLAAPEPEDDEDARLDCLQSCLQTLPADSRALIVEYYQATTRTKIDVRQAIAARLGISRNALSNRMVRLRHQLETCITRCVKKKAARIERTKH